MRCICERTIETAPSTHHGVVHNVWLRQRTETSKRCVHDELGKTVQKFKRFRFKPIPGTRRVIVIDV